MARLFYVAMLSLTVAACQSGRERSYDISGKGVRPPGQHVCGQDTFVVTETGKVRCPQDSN